MNLDELIDDVCSDSSDMTLKMKEPHQARNIAYDCALNQLINPDHLPKGLITPESLSEMLGGVEVKEKESSEFYFELIKENSQTSNDEDDGEGEGEGGEGGDGEGNGEGDGDGEGDGNPKKGKGKGKQLGDQANIDSHDTWDESTGDPELQKDVTKKMIEKGQNETIKSKGNIPSACSEWLEMFSRKSEVNWKRVLRGIVGNKRVGSRSTIMRSDRRFPKRDDLRGKTKERMFNLLVIADVSGSMSDNAVISTLGEVRHICDLTKTDVDLIQVDTYAYKPEKLSKKTKLIERKGQGGTELHPALEKAKEAGIDFNAVVVLTDGGLFGNDITYFKDIGKKVIWLVEPTGTIMDEMNSGKMQAFKLKSTD